MAIYMLVLPPLHPAVSGHHHENAELALACAGRDHFIVCGGRGALGGAGEERRVMGEESEGPLDMHFVSCKILHLFVLVDV